MAAYYNEIDPFAASWLRALIKAGHIADGEVDERSILEVQPDDLCGFTQCHFFAGIGVWSYALRCAGWPDSRPVWTGSCPCQPFSSAGKGDEFADERHLWPAFFRLIRECRPVACFGEQVASKDALAWLDHVSTDLEGEGYTFGAVDTCAAGFGAPHIRQRLYFVAQSGSAKRGTGRAGCDGEISGRSRAQFAGSSDAGKLGDAEFPRLEGFTWNGHDWRGPGRHGAVAAGSATTASQSDRLGATGGFWANAEWVACRDGKARPVEPGTSPLAHGAPNRVGRLRGYGNAICAPVAEEFVRAFMDCAA